VKSSKSIKYKMGVYQSHSLMEHVLRPQPREVSANRKCRIRYFLLDRIAYFTLFHSNMETFKISCAPGCLEVNMWGFVPDLLAAICF